MLHALHEQKFRQNKKENDAKKNEEKQSNNERKYTRCRCRCISPMGSTATVDFMRVATHSMV